jgi:hypothetical protein
MLLIKALSYIGYMKTLDERLAALAKKVKAAKRKRSHDSVAKDLAELERVANAAQHRNEHAVALGALGGKARRRKLSAAERSAIASQGGKAGGRGRKKA